MNQPSPIIMEQVRTRHKQRSISQWDILDPLMRRMRSLYNKHCHASTKMAVPQPFKSTWHDNPDQWDLRHHLLSPLDVYRDDATRKYPKFKKTDPIPYFTAGMTHVWIVLHALWPMAIHWGYMQYTGNTLSALAAVALYSLAYQVNNLHLVDILQRMALKVGFLDSDKLRDRVPDAGINRVLRALPVLLTLRSTMIVFFAYRRNEPINLTWWLPVEMFGYSMLIDLFFYTYHRACHEIDGLWQYHRTHHLTKHPTPILTIYADVEQEAIESVIIPLLSYAVLKLMGLPMGFYDWWMCHQFIAFAEVMGHSGLRAYAHPPGMSSLVLKPIGAALVIEDHDLHHRNGWKKSSNYGKQTRFWDLVFGTMGDRIEMIPDNIDYVNTVSIPLF